VHLLTTAAVSLAGSVVVTVAGTVTVAATVAVTVTVSGAEGGAGGVLCDEIRGCALSSSCFTLSPAILLRSASPETGHGDYCRRQCEEARSLISGNDCPMRLFPQMQEGGAHWTRAPLLRV